MRYAIILATFMVLSFTAVSSTGTSAQQYCGFVNKAGDIVQCGYSNRGACENAIGKRAMCFVNPGEAGLRDRTRWQWSRMRLIIDGTFARVRPEVTRPRSDN